MNNNLLPASTRSAFANVTEAVVNGRITISENTLKNLKQYNNDLEKGKKGGVSHATIKKRMLNIAEKSKENEKENRNQHSQGYNDRTKQIQSESLKNEEPNINTQIDREIPNSTKKTNLKEIYNNNDDRVMKRPISTFISHSDLKKVKIDDKEEKEEEEEHTQNGTDIAQSRNGEVLPVKHYNNMPTVPGKTRDNVFYRYEDLDLEDSDDVLMVSEYVEEIFSYYYKSELNCLASQEMLLKHPNINQNRDILVNWLVKIHNQFNLLPETLYLAVNVMDRFLCKELVSLDKLQLVGTAALFIASKYEEVYSPSCKNFANVTDGACSEEDIKQGEIFILQTLDFKLDYPNPLNFLRRISKADEYHMDCRTVAKYLLEITIVDFRFIGIAPSKCAAAAFFLAKKMMGRPYWDGNFIHYSGGYSKKQLEGCVKMMMEYLEQPVIHEEFYKKYSTRRFCKASVASRDWAKRVIEQGFDVMDLHEQNA